MQPAQDEIPQKYCSAKHQKESQLEKLFEEMNDFTQKLSSKSQEISDNEVSESDSEDYDSDSSSEESDADDIEGEENGQVKCAIKLDIKPRNTDKSLEAFESPKAEKWINKLDQLNGKKLFT